MLVTEQKSAATSDQPLTAEGSANSPGDDGACGYLDLAHESIGCDGSPIASKPPHT